MRTTTRWLRGQDRSESPGVGDDLLRAEKAQTPLRRFGSARDINRLILDLLEGTNFVTGACFRVDGGRFLGEAE